MPTLPLIRQTLIHQYGAALKMLDGAIRQCKPPLWEKPVGQYPFWHVAYHVLFHTDLYLSRSEEAFRPQKFHQPESQIMGSTPWPPYKPVVVDEPYDKPTIRRYASICMTRAAKGVAKETARSLAGESGFPWIPFPRLELHIYNIRHIQHHAGQLGAFLRRNKIKGVGWVATHAL
jgi:hypothetical protein